MGLKLIILDLDNTVYDWVDYYAPCFRAMLEELTKISGLDSDTLKASFKRVHQRHGTSEYSFAIEELDGLQAADKNLSIPEKLRKYASAIQAFRRVREQTLKVYPGVVNTLEELRRRSIKLAAHTDSMMFYAIYRIQRQLGIAKLFDGLFAVRDHGLPPGVLASDVRSFQDPKMYESVVPVTRDLDPSVVKPNPVVLMSILESFQVGSKEALYLGDSLHKDVWMAQECGVADVYAAYGRRYDPDNYRLLVEITHWTDSDVARETKLSSQRVNPRFTIEGFAELLDVVDAIENEARAN